MLLYGQYDKQDETIRLFYVKRLRCVELHLHGCCIIRAEAALTCDVCILRFASTRSFEARHVTLACSHLTSPDRRKAKPEKKTVSAVAIAIM